MNNGRLEAIRGNLIEEQAAVEHQLVELGAPVGDDGVNFDSNEGFADSAQATAERSQMLSMIEKLRDQHSEIVDALSRIEEGRYGKCERCSQEIPIERLEAIPTARYCVTCKQAVGA
jgi:DnaK suppressor protein